MAEITDLTDSTFKDAIQSETPVLVDFWAPWCGPCKAIAPVLKEFAKEYDGKLKIAKLDIDANEKTAEKFHIRSVPSFLVFKKGVVEGSIMGALNKRDMRKWLDGVLGADEEG